MNTGNDFGPRRRWLSGGATAAAIMMLITCCLTAVGARMAGAADDDPFDDLIGQGMSWYAHSEARGFSPYAEIPSEQPGGGPFTRVELESGLGTPNVAFGALGYPSEVAQEGAIGVKELPGEVYAANPEGKFPKSNKFAPLGDSGPYVQVDTPTRVHGEALATYRAFDQAGVHVDGGYSRTVSAYNADLDAMVSEAATRLSGLDLPGGLHIGNFESWVKLTVPRVGEPKADYRFALTGVLDGEKKSTTEWSNQSAGYAGNNDLSISGQGVGIGKVVQDFASKMNESGKAARSRGASSLPSPESATKGTPTPWLGPGSTCGRTTGLARGQLARRPESASAMCTRGSTSSQREGRGTRSNGRERVAVDERRAAAEGSGDLSAADNSRAMGGEQSAVEGTWAAEAAIVEVAHDSEERSRSEPSYPEVDAAGEDARPLVISVIEKRYGSRPALLGVSASLDNGVTALLGPNGAGKSTLIRCLAGIQTWDSGQRLGLRQALGQSGASAGGLYAETTAFPKELKSTRCYGSPAPPRESRSADRDEVAEKARAAGIADFGHRVIGTLSKGYRRRLALAQAMLGDPPILVLDEPVASLDPISVVEIREAIRTYSRSACVLVSTHQLAEARALCDRV